MQSLDSAVFATDSPQRPALKQGSGNCSRGPGLLIIVQVEQEIGITSNRKFVLPREPGFVSSDHSLLITVLFHLIETHTHTHTAPVGCARQVSGEWITFSMPHFT